MELDRSKVLIAYNRLQALVQEYRFDSRVLNVALLKNKARLEETATELNQKRSEIFQKHAAVWSEDEDLPDDVERGQMKTVRINGNDVPRWKNQDHADLASEKLNSLFDGTEEVDVVTVPFEAMPIPEGETIEIWEPIEFMFVDE